MENYRLKIQKQIIEKEKQLIVLQGEINQLKITLQNIETYKQLLKEK